MEKINPCYLIYDWNCELCVHLMKFVKQLDLKNIIVFIPMDDPFAREMTRNISQDVFEGNFHFVLPNGEVLSGDEAIPSLVGALPGGKFFGWVLIHFPGRKFLIRSFYRWVVKFRGIV